MELTTLTRNREIECGLKCDIWKKEKEERIINKEKEKHIKRVTFQERNRHTNKKTKNKVCP